MKIYYSNMGGIKNLEEILPFKIGILESFYGMKKLIRPPYCDKYFLDSGAFSAFMKGVSIDNKELISFIQQLDPKPDIYAALDDIKSPEKSLYNYQEALQAGLTPLPCFHYGEPNEYLQEYFRTTDYVGLGGVARVNKQLRTNWLDWVFSNHPCGQFHGFGIQDEVLMKRYFWKSIDSTSCHVIARFGGIYSPWGSFKINPEVQAHELKWVNPVSLSKMEEYVNSLGIGVSFEKAQESSPEGTLLRCAINIVYFENFIARIVHRPIKIEQGFNL